MEHSELNVIELGVTSALMSGDAQSAFRSVQALLEQGRPFETVLFDTLLAAEGGVGRRWQGGDYSISEEHLATATVETVINLMSTTFEPERSRGRLVVAAAEGDLHSLVGRAISAYTLFLGYDTAFLGANTVAEDLGAFIESEKPDALVLSCAMTNHLLGARNSIQHSHRSRTPVLVGGRAFGPLGTWANLVGADGWAETAKDIPDVLDGWDPDTDLSEELAAPLPPELERIIDTREVLLGKAQQRLALIRGTVPDRRLREEIYLLLGAIQASLLIGDYQVAADLIQWQAETLTHHGYDQPSDLTDAWGFVFAAEGLDEARLALDFGR